jgi:hypothetical protein
VLEVETSTDVVMMVMMMVWGDVKTAEAVTAKASERERDGRCRGDFVAVVAASSV